MTIQGPSLRQATATPQAEAKHAPQPKHAPEVNGESMSVGGKLRTALHGGKEERRQSGRPARGRWWRCWRGAKRRRPAAEERRRSIITRRHGSPKKKRRCRSTSRGMARPSSSSGSQQLGGSSQTSVALNQQQEKPQQQQEEKRAMQRVMHEKEGFTNVIGKGDSAVRCVRPSKGQQDVAPAAKTTSSLRKTRQALMQREGRQLRDRRRTKNNYVYAKMNNCCESCRGSSRRRKKRTR